MGGSALGLVSVVDNRILRNWLVVDHTAQWNSIMGNSLPVIQGFGTFLADDSNQLNSSEARPIQLQTEK